MENQKTEVIQTIKDAQNVLVTVSKDPSIDQLAAAIGMTLILNKMGKHGTAVFSGTAPSTLEFLKPEETLEKNTDSLRDFIISLDKSKADKLRYKVEDQHVKIFITPYRTTIGEQDLVFSHGDFNVDVVLALGVHQQNELDQAITAHGRILHDAKIVSVNAGKPGELGGINLNEQNVSSLSEVMADMSLEIQKDVFDQQIATALLTGIVAETERFSNEKTKPETMSISAKLMAAGANQQLVATKLQVQPEPSEPTPQQGQAEQAEGEGKNPNESADSIKHEDGSLQIKHTEPPKKQQTSEQSQNAGDPPQSDNEVHVDEEGNFKSAHMDELPPIKTENKAGTLEKEAGTNEPPKNDNEPLKRKRMILDPPSSGSTLTASGKDEPEGTSDPLSKPVNEGPMLTHDDQKSRPPESGNTNDQSTPPKAAEAPAENAPALPKADNQTPGNSPTPASSTPKEPEENPKTAPSETSKDTSKQPLNGNQTLDSLEKRVDSPHQHQTEKKAQSPPEPPATNNQPGGGGKAPDSSDSVSETANQSDTDKAEAPDIGQLQNAVDKALANSGDQKPQEPIKALNANPVDLDLGHDDQQNGNQPATSGDNSDDGYLDVNKLDEQTGLEKSSSSDPAQPEQPQNQQKPKFPPDPKPAPSTDAASPASSPPPVPPPMMPPKQGQDDNGDDLNLPPVQR
ncbi:MAG: hypothetical protein U5L95_02430 [Candidatus Saccharibacteria bacterium]|nr:hypothetical protein [Candidatus Saccharibacteria bacterium]